GVGPLVELLRPRLELGGVDDTLLREQAGDAVEPVLEVARGQIVGGVHALDPVAELVDVVDGPARGSHDGDHRRLPARVEGRLAVLALHRSEPVHAAEIVDAVHPALPRLASYPEVSCRRRHLSATPIFPCTNAGARRPARQPPRRSTSARAHVIREGSITSFSAKGSPNGRVASMPSLAVMPRSSALGSSIAPRLPAIVTRSRSACMRVATAQRTSDSSKTSISSSTTITSLR